MLAVGLLLSRAALAAPVPDGAHLTGSGLAVEQRRVLPVSVPDKEPWAADKDMPVDAPVPRRARCRARAVYLSQCHGWMWFSSLGRFSPAGDLFSTVEDFHSPEGANQYLVQYLENAGARVYTVRERDGNPAMAIADNDGEGYAEVKDTTAGTARRALPTAARGSGEDPFDAGTTRRFRPTAATWRRGRPRSPRTATTRSTSLGLPPRQLHLGDLPVRPPRRRDRAHLRPAGPRVDLAVRRDAVAACGCGRPKGRAHRRRRSRLPVGRRGPHRWWHGGRAAVRRDHHPAALESSSLLYTQFNGAPESVYDAYGDDGDPSTRSRWAAWEHPTGEPAVYLSWHSNAARGTASGTVTYIYDGSYSRFGLQRAGVAASRRAGHVHPHGMGRQLERPRHPNRNLLRDQPRLQRRDAGGPGRACVP